VYKLTYYEDVKLHAFFYKIIKLYHISHLE
jgi:hypothetical protein